MRQDQLEAEVMDIERASAQALAEAKSMTRKATLAERRALIHDVAVARPGALGDLEKYVKQNLGVREILLPCIVDIAAAGPAWAVGESNPFKFLYQVIATNTGRPTAQPADHVTVIHSLGLYMPFGTLSVNAELLQRNYAFVMKYGDGRRPYPIHLSGLLRTGIRKVWNPGGSNASAEGSVEAVDIGNTFKFPDRDRVVIMPNEAEAQGYIARATDGESTAPTTSTSLKLLAIARATVYLPVNRQ